MKKHFFRSLLRRRITVSLLLLLQLVLLGFFLINTGRHSALVNRALRLASVFVVLYAVNKREKGEYKLIWSLQILVFPFFGGLFYLLFQFQGTKRMLRDELAALRRMFQPMFLWPGDHLADAKRALPEHAPLMTYLQTNAGFPVYAHTQTAYFPLGEAMHEKLLHALEQAERYIFLEYFILQEGCMWDTVLEILTRKAAEGLDVRVMYDDMGCFLKLPKDYPAQLRALGIRCAVFSPFRPVLSARQNNRDHRKIAVIDGVVAFTGGINLADEYINAVDRFGHWKDTALLVHGKAAWSFTLMFLQMWDVCNQKTETEADVLRYYPWREMPCDITIPVEHGIGRDENPECFNGFSTIGNTDVKQNCATECDGFVQPYADNPTDNARVGEHVYLRIIHSARKYVYINTPYLVIDDLIVSALCLAARSGVDVRIITPHNPDKWYVHTVTRSFYRELIRAGVRIYEYAAGFIHAKSFVSDGCIATVGTANLDFRSLYLHFECGVCLYENNAVSRVYADFLHTLERCTEVTEENSRAGFFARFLQDTLRLLSPLM